MVFISQTSTVGFYNIFLQSFNPSSVIRFLQYSFAPEQELFSPNLNRVEKPWSRGLMVPWYSEQSKISPSRGNRKRFTKKGHLSSSQKCRGWTNVMEGGQSQTQLSVHTLTHMAMTFQSALEHLDTTEVTQQQQQQSIGSLEVGNDGEGQGTNITSFRVWLLYASILLILERAIFSQTMA